MRINRSSMPAPLRAILLAGAVAAGMLAQPAGAASSYEVQVLQEINRYRAAAGLQALVMDATAVALAEAHTRQMQAARKLSHSSFSARRRQSGYSACAENVGAGRRSPQALVEAWKKSGAHNKNLLNRRIKVAGVGQAGSFVTFFACG